MKKAASALGTPLEFLESISHNRSLHKVKKIIENSKHPLQRFFFFKY